MPINEEIAELRSRVKKDFSIDKMSTVDCGRLAEFNMRLYRDEFNAARFSDKEKILEFWRWKYDLNPGAGGVENFGWLASYKGNLIGQLHIIPAQVKIGSGLYPAAWGSDLAIIAEYRNIGVSFFLVEQAIEEIGGKFALVLVGGMNANSYNLFRKSGLVDLGSIPRYIKVLQIKRALSCWGALEFFSSAAQAIVNIIYRILDCGRRARGREIEVEALERFDGEFVKFWDSVSAHYKCIVRRDLSFLNWRYLKQPLWRYSILRVKRQGAMKGFAVLREGRIKNGRLKGEAIGVISDILVDPCDKKSARRLLDSITEFFKSKNALLIKCDILSDKIERILTAAGCIRIRPANKFVVRAYKENAPAEEINSALLRKNWFITSGDSDLDFD